VRRDRGVEAQELLLAMRGKALLATAVLLTGGREAGEDLLQHALERVMRQWHRIERDPEGYRRCTARPIRGDVEPIAAKLRALSRGRAFARDGRHLASEA
jgi:hypothetical protein